MSGAVIFRFRGPFRVPIEVHGSLLLLIGLIVFAFPDPVVAAVFLVGLIGSIFLHELGHAWGAIVQGIPVRRIVVHGGGGFCERGRTPSPRADEFIVVMGPIVNLALWASLSLVAPYAYEAGLPNLGFAFATIAQLNFYLAVFNLLPLQPLDGGKLFQLTLMRFMEPRSATRIAGGVGLVAAILWLPLMVWFLVTYGFLLLFFPSIRLHLQMLRAGT